MLLIAILGTSITGCIKKKDPVEFRNKNLPFDLELLDSTQQPTFSTPLGYCEVLEIAFLYNLDMYAQQYEREAQARVSNATHLQMLPALTLDAFYAYRSKNTGSFTKILLPDNIPEPTVEQFPQISSIQTTFQDDIRLTFNLIDMALAYFRAREEKDRTIIIEQQHLRARQKLVLDVTDAYWKAAVAKQTRDEMLEMIKASEEYQAAMFEQIQKKTISELVGLQITSRLIDQQTQLEFVRYQYDTSMTQLGALMGLLPGTCFEIEADFSDTPEIQIEDIGVLEEEALKNRPELFIKDMEEEITIEKVRESIVPMFPNATLFRDVNYDGNPFLLHNYWWSIGMRASWNLFLIPQKLQEKRAGEAQKYFALATRLAQSIAVMAQVNLSYLNYRDALNQYKVAQKAFNARNRLAEISQIIQSTGEFSGLEVINFRSEALLSRINAFRTYANLKIAEQQINYALGRPFYFVKGQENSSNCCEPFIQLENQNE